MKQFLSLSTERRILIALSVVVVAVAVFYFFVAEAVTVRKVGTVSIQFAPNAGTAGTEFVELEYAGFGVADFDGWSLQNSVGEVFNLSGVKIPSTEKTRICNAGATDGRCALTWGSDDAFNDVGDSLILIDDYGNEAARIDFSDSTSSTLLTADGNFVTEVHGKSDKISICHADSKDAFRGHNASVNSLVQSFEKDNNNNHSAHPDDIIPDFIYDLGKGIGYFPGMNWPEGADFLEAGCQ